MASTSKAIRYRGAAYQLSEQVKAISDTVNCTYRGVTYQADHQALTSGSPHHLIYRGVHYSDI